MSGTLTSKSASSGKILRRCKRIVRHLFNLVKFITPIVNRYAAYEVCRKETLISPTATSDIHIEQVTCDNVSAALSFREECVVNTFRGYLAERQIGVYAYCGDEVVGHAWAAVWRGVDYLIWGYMPVTSDTACISFCSVNPAHRGRKIYQRMLVSLVQLAFANTTAKRVTIDTAVGNVASRRAIERVGFRRLHNIPVLRWCGRIFPLRKVGNILETRSRK